MDKQRYTNMMEYYSRIKRNKLLEKETFERRSVPLERNSICWGKLRRDSILASFQKSRNFQREMGMRVWFTHHEMAHSGGCGGLQQNGDSLPGETKERAVRLMVGCLISSLRAQPIWHKGKGTVGWTENSW